MWRFVSGAYLAGAARCHRHAACNDLEQRVNPAVKMPYQLARRPCTLCAAQCAAPSCFVQAELFVYYTVRVSASGKQL